VAHALLRAAPRLFGVLVLRRHNVFRKSKSTLPPEIMTPALRMPGGSRSNNTAARRARMPAATHDGQHAGEIRSIDNPQNVAHALLRAAPRLFGALVLRRHNVFRKSKSTLPPEIMTPALRMPGGSRSNSTAARSARMPAATHDGQHAGEIRSIDKPAERGARTPACRAPTLRGACVAASQCLQKIEIDVTAGDNDPSAPDARGQPVK